MNSISERSGQPLVHHIHIERRLTRFPLRARSDNHFPLPCHAEFAYALVFALADLFERELVLAHVHQGHNQRDSNLSAIRRSARRLLDGDVEERLVREPGLRGVHR